MNTIVKRVVHETNNGSVSYHVRVINGSESQIKEGSYVETIANNVESVTCFYVNDKLDGEYKSRHINGSRNIVCNYISGKLNGKYERYDIDDNLCTSCTYKDDLLDGKYYRHFTNGLVKEKLPYVKGQLDGECAKYELKDNMIETNFLESNIYRNGVLIHSRVGNTSTKYKNGKIYKQRKYDKNEEVTDILLYDNEGNPNYCYYRNAKGEMIGGPYPKLTVEKVTESIKDCSMNETIEEKNLAKDMSNIATEMEASINNVCNVLLELAKKKLIAKIQSWTKIEDLNIDDIEYIKTL